MTRTSMRFSPAVQNRAGPTLFDMPAVECTFGAPASGGSDDQVGHLHKVKVASQELVQVASTGLDLKMGKVDLQPLGQCLRLVAANRCRTQRMPADIWPTQVIVINQNDPAAPACASVQATGAPTEPHPMTTTVESSSFAVRGSWPRPCTQLASAR